MQHRQFGTLALVLLLFLLAVILLIAPTGASANTRVVGGGDVPFYARIQRGESIHTAEWAAIVFYRPPECVPGQFDLLAFFDWSAFGCTPPTTDGFMILGDGDTPLQIELHGLGAVPVWFVSWSELEAALADDQLTVPELETLPSLITGTATLYHETLHPTEAVKNPMINFVADGNLEDGRTFHVHATAANGVFGTQIVFR